MPDVVILLVGWDFRVDFLVVVVVVVFVFLPMTLFPIGVGRRVGIVLTSRGCCRGVARPRVGGKVTWGSPYKRLFPDPHREG